VCLLACLPGSKNAKYSFILSGDIGDKVVTADAPEEIIKNKKSYTSKFLKEKLVDA
jgi:hypothetical protein